MRDIKQQNWYQDINTCTFCNHYKKNKCVRHSFFYNSDLELPDDFGCRKFGLKHLDISEVKTNRLLESYGFVNKNKEFRTDAKNEWLHENDGGTKGYLLATQSNIHDESFGFGISTYLRVLHEIIDNIDFFTGKKNNVSFSDFLQKSLGIEEVYELQREPEWGWFPVPVSS